jgi:hypothetical protein
MREELEVPMSAGGRHGSRINVLQKKYVFECDEVSCFVIVWRDNDAE